jgi:hypothetical protein
VRDSIPKRYLNPHRSRSCSGFMAVAFIFLVSSWTSTGCSAVIAEALKLP